ncbi:MAG: hypothetical protein H0T52_12265 [Lautropia sp.]|nr:hypothetical protein [Lautropia sp.]
MLTVHSITRVAAEHVGQVVIAASHGGVYAGFCAAEGGVRAVIFNDAGVGRERAGVGSLDYLEGLGIAAAAADSRSCRIGDADDMRECGIVSFVNATAAALGCVPGQRVPDCADRMRGARLSTTAVPARAESRYVAQTAPGAPLVIVMDSVSLVQPSDAGAVVVTASHGGLLGGDPASALKVDALAAVYCDAGFGKDRAGVTRLPALEARGIAAATVSSDSARIGDGQSVYEDGVLSCVNDKAASLGIAVGDTVQELIRKTLGGARR